MTHKVILYNEKVFSTFISMEMAPVLAYKKLIFRIPAAFLVVIWSVYCIEIFFDYNFNTFGVYPRNLHGLQGIVFTHFIHSNTNHLISNSVPLFVLLSSLLFFYRKVAFQIILFGGLLTGFCTWCIGKEVYHIGASGLVYLLFSFQLFSGIIKRHFRLIALSFGIIFLYGSMVWYILPVKEGMSWEGHLSGFLVGLFFAFTFRKKGIVNKPHKFSQTEFDLLFDEDGNFRPPEDSYEIEKNNDY